MSTTCTLIGPGDDVGRRSASSVDGSGCPDTGQPFVDLVVHFVDQRIHLLACHLVVGASRGTPLQKLEHLAGALADFGQSPDVGHLEILDVDLRQPDDRFVEAFGCQVVELMGPGDLSLLNSPSPSTHYRKRSWSGTTLIEPSSG